MIRRSLRKGTTVSFNIGLRLSRESAGKVMRPVLRWESQEATVYSIQQLNTSSFYKYDKYCFNS